VHVQLGANAHAFFEYERIVWLCLCMRVMTACVYKKHPRSVYLTPQLLLLLLLLLLRLLLLLQGCCTAQAWLGPRAKGSSCYATWEKVL